MQINLIKSPSCLVAPCHALVPTVSVWSGICSRLILKDKKHVRQDVVAELVYVHADSGCQLSFQERSSDICISSSVATVEVFPMQGPSRYVS